MDRRYLSITPLVVFLFVFTLKIAAAGKPDCHYTVVISLDGCRWDYPQWYNTPFFDDMEKKGEIVVPQFFIDSNHHMNNEKYVMLAQQLLPNDFEISELRVEYRKEAKLGDTVISYVKYTSKSVTVVLADTDKKPYSVVEFLSKPVPEK